MNLIFLFLNFPNIEIFSEIYALSFAKKKTSDLESLFFTWSAPLKRLENHSITAYYWKH